jgi:hypothetical protein
MTFEKQVDEVLLSIRGMLVEKNQAYGNSALEPVRIFTKADPVEQLLVRIDDKLSRIKNGDKTEDVVKDLIGYLILLKIKSNAPFCERLKTATLNSPEAEKFDRDNAERLLKGENAFFNTITYPK